MRSKGFKVSDVGGEDEDAVTAGLMISNSDYDGGYRRGGSPAGLGPLVPPPPGPRGRRARDRRRVAAGGGGGAPPLGRAQFVQRRRVEDARWHQPATRLTLWAAS